VDKAGIVAKVARCLADHEINIRELSTQSRPEPGTGTPIYTMRMVMDVPASVEGKTLRAELDAIASDLHVDLTVQPNDGP
jgi:glycine cleavage system transcriptional repressor